jgi:ABC-2 type transport system permease protein
LALAVLAAVVLSGLCGLLTWVGAASQGVNISLARMLEASANCLSPSFMFLGLSALAYSIVPRASTAIAYAMVSVTFLWYLVGSFLGVPKWLIGLTPFQHIGLVPAQSFRVVAALVMVAIGVASAILALGWFRRRDLLGA